MLDINDRIHSFLNQSLGRIGTDSYWRQELADHLFESYERCQTETSSSEDAWKMALEKAGDVQSVADELMDLHNPSAINWFLRTCAVGVGIFLVFWLTGVRGFMGFIDSTSALFVLIPAAIGLLFMKWPVSPKTLGRVYSILKSHRVDWASLRPYLRAGSVAGVMTGTALALWRIEDPSTLGPALALAFISALYGLILTTFSWTFLVGLIAALLLNWGILLAAFGVELGTGWTFHSRVLLYPAMATVLTLIAAWFYYGRHEWNRRFQQLPPIAVIVTSIFILQNLEDPTHISAMLLATFMPVLVLYPIQWMVRSFIGAGQG